VAAGVRTSDVLGWHLMRLALRHESRLHQQGLSTTAFASMLPSAHCRFRIPTFWMLNGTMVDENVFIW